MMSRSNLCDRQGDMLSMSTCPGNSDSMLNLFTFDGEGDQRLFGGSDERHERLTSGEYNEDIS